MENNIAKVIFIIVTRNSKLFMQPCLDSILNQTYRDFAIGVIDNDSSDGTADFVRKNYPMVSMIENNKNVGFAKANNQAVKLFKSPYVVFCNPDIVLTETWLEKIMAKVENTEFDNYSIFGGKLLKLKLNNLETGDLEKTEVIDSCGLELFKNGRMAEIGAGKKSEEFNTDCEVLGHSAALVFCRRSALDAIALTDKYHPQGDYFDGSFFIYKEDADLALRLSLLGHHSLFIAEAVAYHLRTFSASGNDRLKVLVTNRKKQSSPAKYYSYRNHLLLIFSNFFASNIIYYFFPIAWFELKKFFYVLVFETRNLSAWWEVIKMIPEIRSKRKFIFSRAKVTALDFRKWVK
jgi:GT2 family glycosyltransferase